MKKFNIGHQHYDVNTLVWYDRVIEWAFYGFSVEGCYVVLLHAQQILERNGSVDGTIHSYLIVAKKDNLFHIVIN